MSPNPPTPPISTTTTVSPVDRSLDARYPIALLPLRLETRFSGNLLKVRIFPDEIFANTHEPQLTNNEVRDGAFYLGKVGTGDESAAWSVLVRRYGAPRAAWIARTYTKSSKGSGDESWTGAAQAKLPDSWIVRAYRGTQVFTVSVPVQPSQVALTTSPNPASTATIGDGLSIDAGVHWTFDFEAAAKAGMAVTIDLTKPDVPPATPPVLELARTPTAAPVGIDVVVIGVKNQSPADGASYLHDLLDAQHYTRGFAFVAPGTPTSNSDESQSGFPAKDPGDTNSFNVERRKPQSAPKDGSNGDRFAWALGLAPRDGEALGVVEHLDGAGGAEEGHALAMNGALWPATLGYFMQQMMAPKFDANTIALARSYFLSNVRPGGPLPAFRVGRVPYGLLPVVSLSHYAPDNPLPQTLRLLRDNHFVAALNNLPRVTPGSSDPDGDLLKALAIDASCQSVRMRVLLGPDVSKNTAAILGPSAERDQALKEFERAAAAARLLSSVGLAADAYLGHVDPGAAADLIGAPLVTGAPLSEDPPGPTNDQGFNDQGTGYISTLIAWASKHDFASIRDDKLPGTARPLLYRVLRHALLLEMDRVSVAPITTTTLMARSPTAPAAAPVAPASIDVSEPELVNLTPGPTATSYGRISSAIGTAGFTNQLSGYLGYLGTLAQMPSAELQRRFGETLDACSHRLEAWITSLASARLQQMRAKQPNGCYYGGFGWVENLQPASATPPAPVGGFIHAPSASHASAAAILRNGYLSRGGSGSAYAVELGSGRVRGALELLDGTRQGESLSALLGYRFERNLHEHNLDGQIADLRKRFPVVAGKTPDGAGPVELVAASNVVDGLALRKAQYVPTGLNATDDKNYRGALAALGDSVDGLADLLTAESVFQAVRGNPNAAAASLDAMAQGTLPPDVDVVRTPASGAVFTQRLAVVLDGAAKAPASATPRGAAEPALDAWVGGLLGNFTTVGCHVVAADGTKQSVTLDALKLRPLDLVALAKTAPSGKGDGELDRRVLDAAGAGAGATVQYAASDVAHSFAEWLELARTIAALLGGARSLLPADLVTPADASSASVTPAIAQQAQTRANSALQALVQATTTLSNALAPVAAKLADSTQPAPTTAELAALRTALQSASLFGVSSYPNPSSGASDLASLAGSTVNELAARKASAPPFDGDPAAIVAAATGTTTAIFGPDFLFLPQITPSSPSDLSQALSEAPRLVTDPNLPRQIVQQIARVRPAVGRWRSLFLYTEALGTASPTLDVAQLPTKQPTWAAAKGAAPQNGTLSLLLHRPAPVAPTATWSGLVIDEWNEMIPALTQSTAIAFRHETPVAEAPQAVLLAVPPTDTQTDWDQESLFATVREALTLAKVRLVDTVDDLRPFLPAICLTGNTANETISTNLLPSLVADPTIQRSA